MTTVMVYGSLKHGYGNHNILRDAVYLGEALTEGRWTMLDLGSYPGVVASGNASIRGELYEVDDHTLAYLDMLEGHPNFYRREVVNVLPIGTKDEATWQQASMYVLPERWQGESLSIIEDGVWR